MRLPEDTVGSPPRPTMGIRHIEMVVLTRLGAEAEAVKGRSSKGLQGLRRAISM